MRSKLGVICSRYTICKRVQLSFSPLSYRTRLSPYVFVFYNVSSILHTCLQYVLHVFRIHRLSLARLLIPHSPLSYSLSSQSLSLFQCISWLYNIARYIILYYIIFGENITRNVSILYKVYNSIQNNVLIQKHGVYLYPPEFSNLIEFSPMASTTTSFSIYTHISLYVTIFHCILLCFICISVYTVDIYVIYY